MAKRWNYTETRTFVDGPLKGLTVECSHRTYVDPSTLLSRVGSTFQDKFGMKSHYHVDKVERTRV